MAKKIIPIIMISAIIISIMVGCTCTYNTNIYGVWWWDNSLDLIYIDYAKDSDINEIYLCDTRFNDSTNQFIDYAKSKDIKVYLLMGEYQWLYDDTNLISKIEKYIEYNATHSARFCGIHLDIEPHQAPDWKNASEDNKDSIRGDLVTKLVKLTKKLKDNYPTIKFSYDIPFWLDQMVAIDGVEKEAYKYMIDLADKVFLMSYRDTAEGIYDVSKEEISYASSIGKRVVLGVETYSTEGDKVSFMEEGKNYMYSELEKLNNMVPSGTGISIHHIKTWHDLKD